MKKNPNNLIWITTAVCLLPILLSIAVYEQLPEEIAIHFDSAGNPNGYAPRFIGAFGIPLLMAGINFLVNFMLSHTPENGNIPVAVKRITEWLIPALTIFLVPITLFMAMGMKIPMQVLIPGLMGVIFIACGNYLPKSRQNNLFGIKLPWTLKSEENWKRTHRMTGYLWVAGGIFLILESFFKQYPALTFFILLPLLVLVPLLYSYFLYKKGV